MVFISKYRHRTIYGEGRKKNGGIIRDLFRQKGIELHEGHAMPGHIHLLLSIPPKFSVSNTVGFIKGKSAIRIHGTKLSNYAVDANATDYISISQLSVNKSECLIHSRKQQPEL